MAYDKRFDTLKGLETDLLQEIVREGEARLNAQFEAACASDQRAMAWAGFLITIVIASVGGALALWIDGKHTLLGVIAVAFSATVMSAAVAAMDATRPDKFGFVGNLPLNWCPEEWHVAPVGENDWGQARVEQAVCLQNAITQNAEWAERSGNRLKLSMDLLLFAVAYWGMVAAAYVTLQQTIASAPSPSTAAAASAVRSR